MQIEERRIQQFVAHIVELQMKKFQMKMNYFEELESILNQQRESQAIQKEQLLQEKQNLYRERLSIQNNTGLLMTNISTSSQPHSQKVFSENTCSISPQDVNNSTLLEEPGPSLDLSMKPAFDEFAKALEPEYIHEEVSLDAGTELSFIVIFNQLILFISNTFRIIIYRNQKYYRSRY